MVFGNNKKLIYLEIPSEISPAISSKGKVYHTDYGAAEDTASPYIGAKLRTSAGNNKHS